MVLEDVDGACAVCSGEENGVFSKIYNSSNESLKRLFACFSVKDKEVLTVLGSSDHLFYAMYYGAKSVDSFDINVLTKYYYYLRKWEILYGGHYYFSQDIFRSHKPLYKLLSKVHTKDQQEENAVMFWKYYLNRVSPSEHRDLYCDSKSDNAIKDLKTMKNLLEEQKFTFYHGDLFDEFSCPKKYDVIITSNILEYAYSPLKLYMSRYNLKRHLKDGGKIIGSH